MLREAQKQDIERIIEIHSTAFEYADNTSKLETFKNTLDSDLTGWLVYEQDEDVVGCLRIRPDHIRVGKGYLLKGEVGDVSVHKSLHGCGLGTKILQESVKWMHGAGFGASRLGGLAKFYSRFGYFRFPRQYVQFSTHEETPRAGGMVVEGKSEFDKEALKHIRLYDQDRDADIVNELYYDTLSRYSGTLITSQQHINPSNGPLNLVFESDNEVKAFVLVYERGAKRTEFEQAIDIVCFGYKRGCEKELAYLTAHTYNSCYDKDCLTFTARYPFDTALLNALGEVDIRYIACETYGGTGTNMMQIINLDCLLEHLKPELESRIDALLPEAFDQTVRIDIGKSTADIRIRQNSIEVLKGHQSANVLKIPEPAMLKLALGLSSFDEFLGSCSTDDCSLPKDLQQVLRLMFPRVLLMPGIWG